MRKHLVDTLKVVVPLALGIWLVIYFYRALDPAQREQVFQAFRDADKRWLWISLVVGWFSHVSRAWRWGYLLEPLGYRAGFWNRYHAVMIGYFMNLLVPRAGEASRGVSLYRTDGVPFEKSFGSILAERAVDMLVLLLIATVTLLLQLEKLDLFRARIAEFRNEATEGIGGAPWWMALVVVLILLAITIAVYLVATRPALRARIMDVLRGFGEGFRSVLRTRHRGAFIFHTLLIWTLYLAMFALGFLCLPATAHVPWAGVFAGFIAGSIGIILVQGGIGVYPAFVAVIVSLYMAAPEGGGTLHPQALAMGWLLWALQTVMLVVLGGLSLLLAARKKRMIV